MLKLPFKKLLIWQKSMQLTKEIYALTQDFPMSEKYGLTSQMCRAAVSVPSNIAEGSQRSGNKEFHHFISIAKGSLAELETQVLLADAIILLNPEKIQSLLLLIDELRKMMHAFQLSLITRH